MAVGGPARTGHATARLRRRILDRRHMERAAGRSLPRPRLPVWLLLLRSAWPCSPSSRFSSIPARAVGRLVPGERRAWHTRILREHSREPGGNCALHAALLSHQPPSWWLAAAGAMLVALVWRHQDGALDRRLSRSACLRRSPPLLRAGAARPIGHPTRNGRSRPRRNGGANELISYTLNTNGTWYQQIINLSPISWRIIRDCLWKRGRIGNRTTSLITSMTAAGRARARRRHG